MDGQGLEFKVKRVFTAAALGLSLLLASGGAGFAQGRSKGQAALEKGAYAEALGELQPLANQGNAEAQYALGWMYEQGKGVTQDYKEAARLFGLAAAQGDASAQYNLGVMYDKGRGVTQDYKEAARLFGLAAAQGNARVQVVLALMYSIGQGVTQDYIYALMWVNIAASSGHANAVKVRDIIVEGMTTEDISKGQALARECVQKNFKGC